MTREDSQGDTIYVSSILSGNGKRVVSSHFKGGSVSAYLGGSEVDLTSATIASEGAVIDVNCIMGGIEFKLPAKMKLQNEVTAILGGSDVEGSPSSVTEGSTLIVREVLVLLEALASSIYPSLDITLIVG
ncbi:hypothetical protein AZF37_05800 [endosymbiont 'TC1' of Trimyema compressum]|uniref:LiaF domain-containing protein n=1 Tax=endosymbiont 'TC1' of Trimyema compressum TaxID=243899 RepID=UPI0007F159DA|nr:LiaF domain-containing protein [endosymbiont 'TC1' of Trimyema compressum]AMP20753.1 hypothetical protein AZF37_05800 [endosymbiont 'TC1' of Trimyema compressum]